MIQLVLHDPLLQLAASLCVTAYIGSFSALFWARHSLRHRKH
jgi:hypothetical protein